MLTFNLYISEAKVILTLCSWLSKVIPDYERSDNSSNTELDMHTQYTG